MILGSRVFMGVPLPDPQRDCEPLPQASRACINASVSRGRFGSLAGRDVWAGFIKQFLILVFTGKALFSVSSHLGMSRQL